MDDTISGGNTAASASPAAGGVSPTPHTESSATSAAPAEQGTQPTGSTTDSTDREGFIPRARFDEVNTRMAAAEKFREQYGWAESVPREQLEQMSQWYARYQGDPGDFLEQAYQEALSHPVHGATVKSRIGRMLASMKAQHAQVQPDPTFEPDVPVMNEQGQIVSRTYSADLVKQMLAHEIGKAVQPLKQDFETRQETAKQAQAREQLQAQAHAQADADVAYVSKRPLFAEHKTEILSVFRENPSMSIREAYDHVIDTKVMPGYGQKAKAQVLSDLQQKANAQTVHAGTGAVSAPPKFKNFAEAHAYYAQHPEEAEAMANRT